MNPIKKISFFVSIRLILMSSKCAHTDVAFKESLPTFRVFNAYTQKQVPGEQGKKAYVELGFEVIDLADGVTLDSLFCIVGKSIKIKTEGVNRFKLTEEDKLVDALYRKVIIYYSQKGSQFRYVLNEIEKKETIYLP